MKMIPNVTYALKSEGENATVAGLLTICLNNMPPGGFDFALMRARNRVADLVAKATVDADLQFEDADYRTAVDAIKLMKWGAAHPDILKFGELFGL